MKKRPGFILLFILRGICLFCMEDISSHHSHYAQIQTLAVSEDGKYCASGGGDNRVIIYHNNDLSFKREIILTPNRRYNTTIFDVKFDSSNSSFIYIAGAEGFSKWNIESGEKIYSFDRQFYLPYFISLHPGKNLAAVQEYYGTIDIFNLQSGEHVRTIKSPFGWGYGLSFSPDGESIVAEYSDLTPVSTTAIWNTVDGSLVTSLTDFRSEALSLIMSEDGSMIVTASKSNIINVRSFPDLALKKTITHPYPGFIRSFSLSQDNRYLAIGGGYLALYDTESGKSLFSKETEDDFIHKIVINDNQLYTAGDQRVIKINNLTDGKVKIRSSIPVAWLTSLSCSTDNSLFSFATFDGEIIIYNGKESFIYNTGYGNNGTRATRIDDNTNKVYTIAIRNSIDRESFFYILDSKTGQLLKDLSAHNNIVNAFTLNPDGSRLYSAGFDRLLKVWDTATYTNIKTIKGLPESPNFVTISKDGKYIVTSGYNNMNMEVREENSGNLLRTYTVKGDPTNSFDYTSQFNTPCRIPGKNEIISFSREVMYRYDMISGALLQTLVPAEPCKNLILTGRGTYIVSVSEDNSLHLYEIATSKYLGRICGADSNYNLLFPTGEDEVIALIGLDLRVYFKDIMSGKVIRTLSVFKDGSVRED